MEREAYDKCCSVNCTCVLQQLENCTRVKVTGPPIYLIMDKVQQGRQQWGDELRARPPPPDLRTACQGWLNWQHLKPRLPACANLPDLNGNTAHSTEQGKPVWSMTVCLSTSTQPAQACTFTDTASHSFIYLSVTTWDKEISHIKTYLYTWKVTEDNVTATSHCSQFKGNRELERERALKV